MTAAARPYHHGNLHRALLDEALAMIEESGPAALSLRALARRLGVSHAAPTHHFADKAALLTAIAAEGYAQLADALEAAAAPAGEATASSASGAGAFLELGVAYVRFAVDHPAHFAVMSAPTLYHPDEPEAAAAGRRAARLLYAGAGRLAPGSPRAVGLAGWCLMHGLATLWLAGNLRDLDVPPTDIARTIGATAFSYT
jgi:AcrR family transcriptional regulator